jgi:hypothetical protein
MLVLTIYSHDIYRQATSLWHHELFFFFSCYLAHRPGFGKEHGILLATSLEIFKAVVSDGVTAGGRGEREGRVRERAVERESGVKREGENV